MGNVPIELVAHRQPEHFRVHAAARVPRSTVAEVDGAIVGFVTVHDDELEQLFVAAPARGTGVAAALLDHGEQQIAAGHDRAWLSVVAGNTRARRFYERQGWSDGGLFQYGAETLAGTMLIPSHRYEKQLR